MKILVMGGTGAMGYELVPMLASNESNTVTVTSRSKIQSSAGITYIQGNAKDLNFIRQVVDSNQYDVIVDFMLYTIEEFKERYELLLCSCNQYIFFSSARVYAASEEPIKEDSPRLLDVSTDQEYLSQGEYSLTKAIQEDILTIGMYGDDMDFYVLKGIIENVLQAININRYDIEKETNNKSYHPGRCANIKIGIDTIGTIGEAHPEVLQNYDIEKRAYLAEINITKLEKYSRENKKYVEIPKFPAVERDIAIIVNEEVEVGQIEKIITKKGKKLLESMKLFDIYRNEKLGENKKSVAYALMFRDKNKTLSDEEINTVMNSIIEELEKTLNAELRK